MDTKTLKQLELTERLQDLLLNRWETLLMSNNLSPTDAATLARFLRENGWQLDPAKLSDDLKGKLTSVVDAQKIAEDDEGLYGSTH